MNKLPGYTARASLYRGSHRYKAGFQYTPVQIGRLVPAQTWGSFKRDHCTKRGCWWAEGPGCGRRQFSAILWDIPWGASWEEACATTPGLEGRPPDRCKVSWFHMWGEWDVPDPSCDTELGVGFGW